MIQTPSKTNKYLSLQSPEKRLLNLSKELPSTSGKTVNEPKFELKVFTYPKEEYNGELDENFIRNGYGIYQYDNLDIYEGEFVEGLREGQGEYLYNDGSVYRGSFKEDKKHGNGSYKFDKFEFDGEWENDHLMSGFTFKINKFLRHKTLEDNSEFINDDYNDRNEDDDSFDLDPDRIDDDDYVKEEIEKRCNLIKSKNYNIDIDLYHIKTGDNKNILLDKLVKNKLNVYQDSFNKHLNFEHSFNCDLYKLSVSSENEMQQLCRCKDNSKKSSMNI